MRTERLRELADHIETKRHAAKPTTSALALGEMELSELPRTKGLDAFNMRTYASRLGTNEQTECETVGCIAGHAATLWPPAEPYRAPAMAIRAQAEEALGLTSEQSWGLFNPRASQSCLDEPPADDITPAQAADACRRLADLGTRAAVMDRHELETLIWAGTA